MSGAFTVATPTLNFTPSTGTVNFTAAGTQTIPGSTLLSTGYNNLTLSGTSAKTTTNVVVNGILSMEGTATASVRPTYGGFSYFAI